MPAEPLAAEPTPIAAASPGTIGVARDSDDHARLLLAWAGQAVSKAWASAVRGHRIVAGANVEEAIAHLKRADRILRRLERARRAARRAS